MRQALVAERGTALRGGRAELSGIWMGRKKSQQKVLGERCGAGGEQRAGKSALGTSSPGRRARARLQHHFLLLDIYLSVGNEGFGSHILW